jgi:hypothetical protein
MKQPRLLGPPLLERLTRLFAGAVLLLVLSMMIAGCAPQGLPASPTVAATQTVFSSSLPVTATSAATATLIPTLPASPTPMPQAVTVAAVKGNLFIRRGPDMAFNPVAVLADGQSAAALGRDVLAKWLEIPLPGDPEKNGWVSIQTTYSAVSGDVTKLPAIEPTDWPVPAFLRNCTFHNMTAEPGGILLPALTSYPANDVRVNPGMYRVYDTDVEGSPEVLKVELREGSAIDIRLDGNGFSKKCPQP